MCRIIVRRRVGEVIFWDIVVCKRVVGDLGDGGEGRRECGWFFMN